MEKPYYYNLQEIINRQRRVMFVIGGRELGKTYSVKDYILTKLLENENDKMIYIVRYQTDKQVLKDLFDDVIKQEKFKDVTYKISTGKKSAIFINGVERGLIVATTETARAKRITATNYYYLLFDEFLVPKGGRYAPDEVENVLSIMQTVLRDKGDRAKDAKTFFLANSTKLFNPYFEDLGFQPDPTKTFNKYDDAIIQICNMDDYKERIYEKSDVHNFFKRSASYSAMSFDNSFSDNTEVLTRKRSKYDKPLFTFKIKNKTLGIWYDEKFEEILFSYKTEPNVRARFSISMDEQDDATAYKAWYSTDLLKMLHIARDRNSIWFENANVKATATDLLKYLKVY